MKTQLSHSISSLKSKAKKIAKENAISHSQALDMIAIEQGYSSWSLLVSQYNKNPINTVSDLWQAALSDSVALISAGENVGKVSLAMNLALDMAENNTAVFYLTLAHNKKQLLQRLQAVQSAVAYHDFEKDESQLPIDISNKIKKSTESLANLPLSIVEIENTLQAVTQFIQTNASTDSFIIIDCLQLFSSPIDDDQVLILKKLAQTKNNRLLLIHQQQPVTCQRHCDWHIHLVRERTDRLQLRIRKARNNSHTKFNINFDPLTGICHIKHS